MISSLIQILALDTYLLRNDLYADIAQKVSLPVGALPPGVGSIVSYTRPATK